MVDLFQWGGPLIMSVLTIIFVWLFYAAWKAPAWVRDIGRIAVIVVLIWQIKGLINAANAVMATEGVVSPMLILGATKASLISIGYALIIYLVSLIIRIIQKPRI